MSFTKTVSWVTVGAVSLFWTGFVTPEKTQALTLTATAECSATPPTAPYPTRVVNGDCQIIQVVPTQNPIVGNGIDEATFWDFDFKSNLNYSLFSAFAQAGNNLTSAVLSLTLIPKTSLISTDLLGIAEIQSNVLSDYTSLPASLNTPYSFTQDLLTLRTTPYSSQTILSALFSGKQGIIPFRYEDDAIVVSSRLELSIEEISTPIPEPSAIFGILALGIGGAGTLLKHQKQRGSKS